jgi:hypothetical protein
MLDFSLLITVHVLLYTSDNTSQLPPNLLVTEACVLILSVGLRILQKYSVNLFNTNSICDIKLFSELLLVGKTDCCQFK